MLLNLLKRVVKATLHSATEEWLLETGVSDEMIDELRARREALAAQAVARADALAASRLDADDEQDARDELPALPPPASPQLTTPGGADEGDLMEWVYRQRQANVGWAEIAKDACQKGCRSSEDALRSRYKRWREKHAQAETSIPTA